MGITKSKRAADCMAAAAAGAAAILGIVPAPESGQPAAERKLIMVKIEDLMPSPDNYRTVRETGEKWERLLGSIRKKGILQPLSVRPNPHQFEQPETEQGSPGSLPPYEVLCGHRRLRAAQVAGLATVPAYDHGAMSDEDAFDLMALDNEHEELTPLEQGRMIATWLDKYKQDTKAVAARLQMSERWVQRHAQIDRGLTAEWKKVATEGVPGYEKRDLGSKWTTAHWEIIARMPREHQDQALKLACGLEWYQCEGWTVGELQDRLTNDRLPLAKAPFEIATCAECVKQTGAAPLLWAEQGDEDPASLTGDKSCCLDRKCYEKKVIAAQRAKFEETRRQAERKHIEKHSNYLTKPLPVSLVPVPKDSDWSGGQDYQRKLSPVKKVFRDVVESDRVEVVKEGTKGAVPAIVVAGGKGRQQNSLIWAKIKEKPKQQTGRGGAPAETPEQKAKREAHERREAQIRKAKEDIIHAVYKEIAGKKLKDLKDRPFATVAICCMGTGSFPWVDSTSKAWEPWSKEIQNKRLHLAEKDFTAWLLGEMWAALMDHAKAEAKGYVYAEREWPRVLVLGPLFGLNPMRDLQERMPKEKSKKDTQDGKAAADPGECRVCGCTEDHACPDDGSGDPCHWVEPGLCSTCACDGGLAGTEDCLGDSNCEACPRRAKDVPAAEAKKKTRKRKSKKGKKSK